MNSENNLSKTNNNQMSGKTDLTQKTSEAQPNKIIMKADPIPINEKSEKSEMEEEIKSESDKAPAID